jgi:hypothetical protein
MSRRMQERSWRIIKDKRTRNRDRRQPLGGFADGSGPSVLGRFAAESEAVLSALADFVGGPLGPVLSALADFVGGLVLTPDLHRPRRFWIVTFARTMARTGLALGLVIGTVSCGGGDGTSSVAPTTAPGRATTVPVDAPSPAAPASSPRWEEVETIAGDGPTQTPEFTIGAGALQWRIRWTCDAGTLRITTTPPPRRPAATVDGACPGQGEGFAIHTGPISLSVEASGPWEAIVEQQVDTPLDEPPPPEASVASVLSRGDFFEVENPGRGTASILELVDGRLVLRLEDFETVATPELFVWLSQAPDPRTSIEAVEAPHVELGPLRASLGNQNYDIPAAVTLDQIRSVVIWCEPVNIVYTAAALAGSPDQ